MSAIVFGAELATIILGMGAVLSGITWVGRKIYRGVRRVDVFLADFEGTPARDGVPERPGVMHRLAAQDETLATLTADVAAIRDEVPKNGLPLAHKVDAMWHKHLLDMKALEESQPAEPTEL